MSKKKVFAGDVKVVLITKLMPDPNQPRQDFDEVEMNKLKDSIMDKGIMTPITVEPLSNNKYLIVDGERRFRTAVALKMNEVPVNILPFKLNEFDRNIIRFQLQETHKQWTPFEKAEAMSYLKQNLGLSNIELAKALAIAYATCLRYLSLLSFPVGSRKIFVKAKAPFNLILELSYINSIMPEKIKNKVPGYIEMVLEKYKKGYLKSGDDLRIVNKLIKAGCHKEVIRFFKELKYTTSNAAADSGLIEDNFLQSISRTTNSLRKKLQIVSKSKIELNESSVACLNELNDIINEII